MLKSGHVIGRLADPLRKLALDPTRSTMLLPVLIPPVSSVDQSPVLHS